MAITSTGLNAATHTDPTASKKVADKTSLGKDDFMKLLLVQLQYQDPTEPMDAEKILTQTSQLASLEASDNTKTALEKLTSSLGNTQQFSTIAAIGKRADLGSDAISHDEGSTSSFEMYFPKDVTSGTISITDNNGNQISTMDIAKQKDANGDVVATRDAGVYKFDWNGQDSQGNAIKSGVYHINATYKSSDGTKNTTRVGAYPIESVKFDQGNTYVKLGSSYVPLDSVKEVY